jgi:hypothetical protein
LRGIQAERKDQERLEMLQAGRIYRLHARQNKLEGKSEPYNPAADGFVFTAAQIEEYLRRENLHQAAFAAGNQHSSAA